MPVLARVKPDRRGWGEVFPLGHNSVYVYCETPDEDGSFMSVIHRTIMNVRSLFNGLDGSVLPGLIDGEKRNVDKYDDALKTPGASAVAALLTAQRDKIQQKIAVMEAKKAAYEATT